MVPIAVAAGYAGLAFSAVAPEPSSLPLPGFVFRRAEEEAARGLRCLLRIGELRSPNALCVPPLRPRRSALCFLLSQDSYLISMEETRRRTKGGGNNSP
ncbi:alpha carbonic anhydrase 8 [Hordeum vulgare]|nr:alpha carbonic anhydrase 8 [Hordeum vulgare]